jgi:hypothetical protein
MSLIIIRTGTGVFGWAKIILRMDGELGIPTHSLFWTHKGLPYLGSFATWTLAFAEKVLLVFGVLGFWESFVCEATV